jgi:hypothetical protein
MRMSADKRAIDKIYKRRDRYEIPEWQRQEVWSVSKKQNLIDSVLRGWKLPKFYFLKLSDDPEQYEVVDGQQRLASIFEFFDNELALGEVSIKEFGGPYCRDLRDRYRDAFDDFEIEFDEIEEATEEEVKEFFQRLQEGLPLTSSEKLNSVHSKLRDFLVKQTKHSFFQKVTASNKRYGHFDILAKVAAVEIDGIEVGLRYDDLRAVFESQAAFSARSNVATRITETLEFLERGFPNGSQHLHNRTIVQSLLTLACALSRSGRVSGSEQRVAAFFDTFMKELNRQVELGQKATDGDYLRFQRTVNANVKAGARIRQEILVRKFLAFDPSFATMLGPTAVAESGLHTAIRSDAAEIARLITEVNERYAAQHGIDLVKPTNKTAQALAQLGDPVLDYRGYESLIDGLYFLFHEGIGNRLEGKMPESFRDVDALRTQLRHDLDHGAQGSSRAKRRKGGDAFKKYSGEASPAGLAPERFAIVQSNLLAALKRDLGSVSW